MRDKDIRRLGRKLYVQHGGLRGYKPRMRLHTREFGLDTEYYVDREGKNKLLTWQLSHICDNPGSFNHVGYQAGGLWDSIYEESCKMLKARGHNLTDVTLMVYYVYFSTAEGQWLELDDRTMLEVFGSHQVNQRRQITKRRSVYLFDLSTFFPLKSLKEAAATFGLSKLDYDVSKLSPENLKDPDFMRYARNDAYITAEMGRRFREMTYKQEGIDILLTRTPGSYASAMFRSRFLNSDKPIRQDWTLLRRKALRAAVGGRKESFYRGSKPLVFEYDGLGMYPAIIQQMGILPLPEHWRTTNNLTEWLGAKGGFGRILFEYPESCNRPDFKPDLPVECGERMVYPLRGCSHCTTWEARNAIAKGAKVYLTRGFFYNEGVTWLAEFEKELVAKRMAAKGTALEAFYKLLSVAIVGKTCQKNEDYNVNDLLKYAGDIPADIFKGVVNLPVKKDLKLGTLFMPEWFCLILGAARANVAKAADRTNALQIATDAVMTEKFMGESFEVDGISYRLERAGDYVAYRAGLYRVGEFCRYHGASREVADLILTNFTDGPDIEYETRRIATIRQWLHNGIPYGKSVRQKRHVKLGFDGKRILINTGETLPLTSALDVVNRNVTDYVFYEHFDEEAEKRNKLRKERSNV